MTPAALVCEKISPIEFRMGQEGARKMPTPPKALDNMAKKMSQAERQARADAEQDLMPDRSDIKLVPPSYIARGDAKALKYWNSILERMEGISLLDDLDAEVLGVYCSMLSRRDATQAMYKRLLKESKAKDLSPETLASIMGKLDSMLKQLQSQERTILQYADKLGLTPSGRVSLARKRSANVAVDSDPDADLYGN